MDFREFFTQLFTQLNTKDSWLILLFLFISFLIGLLWGRLSYRRKYKRLEKAIKQKQSDYNVLKAELDALQENYDLKSADLQKVNLELESLTLTNKTMEEERVNLHNELYAANERIQGLETNQRSYMAEVEGLNNQLLSLKTQNEQLAMQLQNIPTPQTISDDDLHDAETDERLTSIEQKLAALTQENQDIKEDLNEVLSITTTTQQDNRIDTLIVEETIIVEEIVDIEVDDDVDSVTEIMEPGRSETAIKAIKAALGSKIPVATAEQKDDLKRINGIGPFIEDKLNNIGIYTYEQITKFDTDFINLVTDAIQFFPGRIERDDWVGQAGKLA